MKGKHAAEAEKEAEKRKYPIGPEHYLLYEEIGQGVSAAVHRALCVPLDEVVAIKILDFERDNCDLMLASEDLSSLNLFTENKFDYADRISDLAKRWLQSNNIYREAQTMILVDHPNVLRAHCSFVSDHTLWVVMPFMAGGSCLHILKAAYPDGFEEVVIATVLKETLKGLEYLHHHGHIHRDVKAGNVLIDSRGAVKLGDFGVSACLFDSGDRQRTRNTFVGTPCWMAPEVMEQLHGYDFKADIWSFGITALELAHGHAPFSKYPPMKVLLMTLQSAPPGLDYERDRKFSKSFKQMIASCLVKDPTKRPSARKLLKHSFFKQARSSDYIARTLLEGLPALGDRIQLLKRKEEDMLAQKKMPDGQKEELSQNEYKRGISSWNFNLDDVKAQASLIQDVEENISDNNHEGCSTSFALEGNDKRPLQFSSSSNCPSDAEDNEGVQNQSAILPVDTTRNTTICEKLEEETGPASSSHQVHNEDNENKSSERLDPDMARVLDAISAVSNPPRRAGSSGSISLPDVPTRLCRMDSEKNIPNLVTVSSADDILSDLPPKANKPSGTNGDDADDKAKIPVVQQKGRFKVTSENVDLEKMAPSPTLQKSLSMQVIPQHNTSALSPLQLPSDPISGNSLYGTLHAALQANIQQRECILTLMKQVTSGELIVHRAGDTGGTQLNNITPERTLLESAHDREKDLLHEITELQWKFIRAQEELKKFKIDNNAQNEEKIAQKLPSKTNGD